MSKTIVIHVVGCVLLLGGLVLLGPATGDVVVSLGIGGPIPEGDASAPAALAFWAQLSFIRMFAVTAIGFSAVCFWAGSQLTSTQHTSFLILLVGVFAVMGAMVVGQQVAIWNRGAAGWSLVGVLSALLLTCLAAVVYDGITNRSLASA